MIKNDIAISVKNLKKVYKIYQSPSDVLKETIFRRPYHRDFVALEDIDFEVKKGEVVGIIGPNGSGKSTLLKIIANTLDKTKGEVKVNGKVTAILNLGLGFNPENTGRQNIYNGGIVLCMSKREIDSKIESIIDFSEIREFIDQPFKTYSTGMQTRLTFSVATAMNPEILIIDEALSAGDTYFMAKCAEKIDQLCNSGATVLFVSHSLPMVQKLCNRAIYLEKGRIVAQGPSDKVCQAYQSATFERISQDIKKGKKVKYSKKTRVWQHGPIDLTKVEFLDKRNREKYAFYQFDKVTMRLHYLAKRPVKNLTVWVVLIRADGVFATSYLSASPYQDLGIFDKKGHVDIIWNPLYLCEGDYLISCGLYPYKKNIPLNTLPTDSYVYHDKAHKISIKSRDWPRLTIYEQPLTVIHKNIKLEFPQNILKKNLDDEQQ